MAHSLDDGDPNDDVIRSWQEITAEAAKETNAQRLTQLAVELERALEERDKKLKPQTDAS